MSQQPHTPRPYSRALGMPFDAAVQGTANPGFPGANGTAYVTGFPHARAVAIAVEDHTEPSAAVVVLTPAEARDYAEALLAAAKEAEK